MESRAFRNSDREAVCAFLIALNRNDRTHINWNWARFEWMYEHPEFDRDAISSIRLWLDGEAVVGAAIYDMYFGEAFCAALPGYGTLYPEILDYAWRELRDAEGLKIGICEDSVREREAAAALGFAPAEQTETVMALTLDRRFSAALPEGFRFAELDPAEEPVAFQWVLWRGFDHGEDRAEFEREDPIVPRRRNHFRRELSLTAVDPAGEAVAYGCLWYHEQTDYAYLEPLCTAPAARGKGIARALLFELLNRAAALGAARAYVISDMEFYRRLGFETERRYRFFARGQSE